MTRTQQYIDSLLDHFPKWELANIEHRNIFDQIKERLATSENFQDELAKLYKVNNFSDFTLSILWIADRVEMDPSMLEATSEEETLVFTKFRQAISDMAPVSSGSQSDTFNFSSSQVPEVSPDSQSGFNLGETQSQNVADAAADSFGLTMSAQSMPQESSIDKNIAGGELEFSRQLDTFLEAVQSGAEDRIIKMSTLQNGCKSVVQSGVQNEYKDFSQLLLTFLDYVEANQFVDDIRVMNIISNIQSPFSQYVTTQAGNRTGILDPALEILRDFKTMFE